MYVTDPRMSNSIKTTYDAPRRFRYCLKDGSLERHSGPGMVSRRKTKPGIHTTMPLAISVKSTRKYSQETRFRDSRSRQINTQRQPLVIIPKIILDLFSFRVAYRKKTSKQTENSHRNTTLIYLVETILEHSFPSPSRKSRY